MRIDAAVAELATMQHGVVAVDQCHAVGMTPRQVQHRVEAGRWTALHVGVYAIGHATLSPHGRYLAAVLARGPNAAASHRTAASLHRLQPHHAGAPHVLSPVKHRPRTGIEGHWTRWLPVEHVTARQGVPVTTLPRTLIDLADLATPDEFEEALRAAERLHGFDRTQLKPIHGRRGTRLIRQDRDFARGKLVEQFRRFVRAAGLSAPEYEVPFGQYELDALWRDARVAVEIDDYSTHLNRDAFDRDRVRDRVVAAAGLTPVRVTSTDLGPGRIALERQLRALGVV